MKRTLLICVALAAGLTGCSGGGPSQAEVSACAPFLHLTLPAPRVGSSLIVIVPRKWVTDLLNSGNPRLVQDARKLEPLQHTQTIRDIVSECRRLGGRLPPYRRVGDHIFRET